MNLHSLKQILGGRNLYLIGMMGSGKTVTGAPLAEKLEYGFVDTDEVIEKVAKKSITSIFEEDGETTFREIETQILKEIGTRYSLVIATGGGIVKKSENWGILHQGVVIWINPEKEYLLNRLQSDLTKRPLLTKSDLEGEVTKLNNERKRFYQEADLTIFVKDESPIQVAQIIIDKLFTMLSQQEN